MNNLTRNRWQVRLAALVIFVLGFAAGALALNAYRSWSRASGRERGRGHFERTLERLDLTDEQRPRVKEILAEARAEIGAVRRESEPRMAEIRRRSDERLRQVLTPEQWQRFQQMKDEARPRRRGRGGGGDERPREP
jgi:Spy/CpxP family protein refolding chaperone